MAGRYEIIANYVEANQYYYSMSNATSPLEFVMNEISMGADVPVDVRQACEFLSDCGRDNP